VLQPLFESTFSDSSFGFRPDRGAHQAVRKAQGYIREGKRWVVDIDLEKFFDSISHELLLRPVRKHTDCAWVTMQIPLRSIVVGAAPNVSISATPLDDTDERRHHEHCRLDRSIGLD
jgi:Reverse transcriptase (RNA-dependent DNA polymerase)